MIFGEPSRQPLPNEPEFGDHRVAVIKGGLGSIPVLGNVLAEELGLLAPPLTRRRDAWFEDLARRLRDLETKVAGFRFDNLSQNEQFVSATAQATQAALRTHQQEKLDALRNAVLNVAAGTAPAEDKQWLFLHLVDQLSALHLRLLAFAKAPAKYGGSNWFRTPQGSPMVDFTISAAFPGADEQLLSLARSELTSLGLISIPTQVPRAPGFPPFTRTLGEELLRFIREPVALTQAEANS
jgi:hypothetical protein